MAEWDVQGPPRLIRQLAGRSSEVRSDYFHLLERLTKAHDPRSRDEFDTVPAVVNSGELPADSWIARVGPNSPWLLVYQVDEKEHRIILLALMHSDEIHGSQG
jgi:hypothetical protein